MFKNSYQSGLLSIFYSCGSHPLALWEMEVNNGHIKRLTDNEVNSIVLEIVSTNVATTYITCPPNNKYLGIKLPFLVMIVKNLKRYFSFEITILDDKNMRRRFRISNFQSTTKIKPFCTTMPIGLSGGWNQIQFNLSDFTRRAYGTQFIETLRVQVHANVRLRRIYFAERLYTEEELPQDYKLYLPLDKKSKKGKKAPEAATATKDGTEATVGPEAPSEEKEEPKPVLTVKKSVTGDSRKSILGRKSTIAESKKSTVIQTPEEQQEENPTGEAPPASESGAPESEEPAEVSAEAIAEAPPEAGVEAPEETPAETTGETAAEESAEPSTVNVEKPAEPVEQAEEPAAAATAE